MIRFSPRLRRARSLVRRSLTALGLALGAVVLGLALGVTAAQAASLKIEKVTSPGGIKAWLIRDRLNPVISLHIAFEAGSAYDPAGKEGVTAMMSSLLDEGAGDMRSLAFQRRVEDLSITLSFSTSSDALHVRLKTLRQNRDEAFRLMGMALTKPRFDQDAVERVRGQYLASYRSNQKMPSYIAGRLLMSQVFGAHPYARPKDGTARSLRAITIADLKAQTKLLARDRMFIAVVGDISAEELGVLLDRALGGLPAKTPVPRIAHVEPTLSGKTTVNRFDIPQSRVIFVQKGLKRLDKDFYAAFVLNHIIGGGSFTSRLYQEVREKRGLAYSVYTYLNPMDHAELWVGGVSTKNERVGESIALIRKEWQRAANEGITQKELTAAKQFLMGNYPVRFTDSAKIASFMVALQRDGLPPDYFRKRNSYIDAVTLADVNRVAKRLMRPENLTFIIVGKPAAL